MYIAKYGLISMNGQVAKLAASHDFRSYVSNMVFRQATHKAKEKLQSANADTPGQRNAKGRKSKKECCAL